MGIPHLITFLQPYATVESLAGSKVVIDGPALAHHIYYICLKATPGARNAFEGAPSYFVLVRTAFRWLDALRKSDVEIKKLYFDGYLPSSKFSTRSGRLIEQTRRLTKFHHENPTPCRTSYPRFENELSNVFDKGGVSSSVLSLPSIPFLVPAILEAFVQSAEYGAITEVVPGEADEYCAQYCLEHGGLVLTGDSDLLVHDLGSNGTVSFIKDVWPISKQPDTLRSLIYHPTNIAERLNLLEPHLLRSLAFEMVMDPHISFPQLLRQAQASKAITSHPKEFADFLKEYVHSSPCPTQSHNHSAATQFVLRRLDARISEFVLQTPAFARRNDDTPRAEKIHIFLPFLLDCPIRTSAWECSTTVRQLGYGILNFVNGKDEQILIVFEHRKQSGNSDGRELQLPNISMIPDACGAMLILLAELREKLPDLTGDQIWIALAIHHHESWSIAQDKSSLTALAMEHFQKLECSREESKESRFGWEVIQFFAELQASHYSCRMLKQILEVVIAHSGTAALPKSLQLLHEQLQYLPDLTEILTLVDASSFLRKAGNQETMVAIQNIVEVLLPSPVKEVQTLSKSTKKKRKRDMKSSEKPEGRKKPTNMFELLENE